MPNIYRLIRVGSKLNSYLGISINKCFPSFGGKIIPASGNLISKKIILLRSCISNVLSLRIVNLQSYKISQSFPKGFHS
jgi:hypothetical protein